MPKCFYQLLILSLVMSSGCGDSTEPVTVGTDAAQDQLDSDYSRENRSARITADLANHHQKSSLVLQEAFELVSQGNAASDSSASERLQDFTRRSFVLTAIASAQAEIGDTETADRVLETIERLNAETVGGTSPGLDESDASVSAAVAHAVAGHSTAVERILEKVRRGDAVVAGQSDIVVAEAYAEICRALVLTRQAEAADGYLDRLKQHVTATESPFAHAQLGKAQLALGKNDDCDETIGRLLAKAKTPDQRLQAEESLATLVAAQANSGHPAAARTTLAKCDPFGVFADTARYELSLFHARTLNFRDALTLATEINDGFLRARALFKSLNRQFECGPVFAASAIKLTDLADEQLNAFRDQPALHKQIQGDHAALFAKWDLLGQTMDSNALDPKNPLGNLQMMSGTAKSLSAALAVEDALGADLPSEQNARIQTAQAVNSALAKDDDAASDYFSDALQSASQAVDPSVQIDLLQDIGSMATQLGFEKTVRAWCDRQADRSLRAAALAGMAKGLRIDEFIQRAAKYGVVIAGQPGPAQPIDGNASNIWSKFVDLLPEQFQSRIQNDALLLLEDVQLLAVATPDGFDIAIPPTFGGLKGWVGIVGQSPFFSADDRLLLTGLVERAVGTEQRGSQFTVHKQTGNLPANWVAFSFKQLDRDSVSSRDEPVSALISSLSSDDETIRREAVEALVRAGDVAIPPLIACSESENDNQRAGAANALGQLGERAVPPLRDLLRSREPEVVEFACSALARIGGEAEAAVPELIAAMKRDAQGYYGTGFTNVPSSASYALEKIGKASVEPLVQALGNEQGLLLLDIISTLGEIGPDAQPAVAPILNILRDRRTPAMFQACAAEALGNIGRKPDDVVPVLVEKLRSNDNPVRECAIRALGDYGSSAKAALLSLKTLLNDPDERIRESAARAIKLIENPELE